MICEKHIEKRSLIGMYRKMVRIRRFENEAIELAMANLTRAAIHTCNGQEAIAVGVCANLRKEDYIVSNHRGHGHCVAKGADLVKMFAELMARETGYCKGKGGSMHIADLKNGMLGANGVVGGGIPISVGAAFALKYKKSDNVVVCFFGDGASNQGAFHEAVNMAAIWNLPVVFVCENNQYAISMHVSKSMRINRIAERAKSYGIKGVTIDGNKLDEVYGGFKKIVNEVRRGSGPVLAEMLTYRMSGHYFGDSENYRSKEEVTEWKKKDPIEYAAKILSEQYGLTQEEIKQINQEEKERVLNASQKAKDDPFPMEGELANDLYDPTFEKIEWRAMSTTRGKAGV